MDKFLDLAKLEDNSNLPMTNKKWTQWLNTFKNCLEIEIAYALFSLMEKNIYKRNYGIL